MESLEISARTVSDAVEQALARLGKTRDEVDISVLSEGSRGILGIGHEDARILVSVRQEQQRAPTLEQVEAVAQEVLEEILAGMGYDDTTVEVKPPATLRAGEPPSAVLDITGDDLGALIGRRGETLSSLQFLVNLIAGRRLRHWSRIVVDVEGYRGRREETLRGLAQRMADRVQAMHRPMALEAMPANERRIIHMALQSHPTVTTQSTGEGEQRKVVIMPKTETR